MADISDKMFPEEESQLSFQLEETIFGGAVTFFGMYIMWVADTSTIADNDPKDWGVTIGSIIAIAGVGIIAKTLATYLKGRYVVKACKEKPKWDTDHATKVAERYVRSGPLLGYNLRHK